MATAPVASFTEAIYKLLENFAEKLKLHGATEHSVTAYIFGGCAVHLYGQSRVSSDLDLEIETVVISSKEVNAAKREGGKVLISVGPDDVPDILEIDRNFTNSLGPLHEDFVGRARVLEKNAGSPLVVLLPSAEDIALSKLGRLSEADVSDILLLMDTPGASWDRLEELTKDTE